MTVIDNIKGEGLFMTRPIIEDLFYEMVINEDFETKALELINNGIDINGFKEGKHGFNPVMFASYRGWLHQVKFLVEHGADINLRNQNGENALMASCMDRPSFVTFELTGIDRKKLQYATKIINEEYKKYRKESIYLERREILKYLISRGINVTDLCYEYEYLHNASALDIYMLNPYMNDLSIIDLLMNSKVPLQANPEIFYSHSTPAIDLCLTRKLSYYEKRYK